MVYDRDAVKSDANQLKLDQNAYNFRKKYGKIADIFVNRYNFRTPDLRAKNNSL
jgi:hypothetical protein